MNGALSEAQFRGEDAQLVPSKIDEVKKEQEADQHQGEAVNHRLKRAVGIMMAVDHRLKKSEEDKFIIVAARAPAKQWGRPAMEGQRCQGTEMSGKPQRKVEWRSDVRHRVL